MAVAPASARRRVLERFWIVGSVAYGALRIAVADRTVTRYGVNIWAFAAVELSTAWLYGLATARVVGALVDRSLRSAARGGAVAASSFLAPEGFIVVTGRDMPSAVYLVIAGVVAVLGSVAAVTVLRRVRAGRSALAPEAPAPNAVTPR
jgi:hypothetical protein